MRRHAPALGDEREILWGEPGFQEPWRLVARKEGNPVQLYRKRMRIEALFRDLKSLLHMGGLLRRVSDELVKEGLITLILLTWLFVFLIGLFALVRGLVSEGSLALTSYRRREISLVNFGLHLLTRMVNPASKPLRHGPLGKLALGLE